MLRVVAPEACRRFRGWALSAAAQSSRRRPPPPQARSLGFFTFSASSAAASPVHREVRTGAPADSSAAAAGQVLTGPKASETVVGYLKRMMLVVGLLFSLVVAFGFSDTAFLVWRLSHPVLPNLPLREPHVEMSKAEDELLAMMNDVPQFVIVFGIPGCGKTTTILSAAKRRGKAVFYYCMGGGASLKTMEERFQKEYGAMFPSLHELVRGTSGATVWDRFAVAGNVWRRWLCPDASSSLVIILDNVNKLQESDLDSIATIGKRARDENRFSVWLVSSEERGLGILDRYSDSLTRAMGFNLPSVPEEELVGFVDSALGSQGKITTDLAERFVYWVGGSLAHLWQLVDKTKQGTVERVVLPHVTRRKPGRQPPEAQDFLKRILDAPEGVKLSEVPETVDWSCLQPQHNVAKVRNRWCRDVISLQVAEREVTDAKREVTDAKREVTDAKRKVTDAEREVTDAEREVAAAKREFVAAKREVVAAKPEVDAGEDRVNARWWEAALLKDAESALGEALQAVEKAGNVLKNAVEKQEGARKLLQEALRKQDEAATVASMNQEAIYHALSTFYKTMALQTSPLPPQRVQVHHRG